MSFSESEVIEYLARIFATSDSRVIIGIGDDAAVVAQGAANTVVTTDMAVEGVHFKRIWSSAHEIGRKITAANLADIYAMGAEPRHLVVALSLTGNESMNWIKELAQGIKDEADTCNVSVIGGDLVRGPVVTISMTAIGEVSHPILRSGAQVGDGVFLSGLPGLSAAGLFLLSKEINISALRSSVCAERAVSQFRAPEVNYSAAIALLDAHALCDVSDGLLTQGQQVAKGSGVRLEISSEWIEASSGFRELSDLAQEVGAYVWDWIACGGEDHVFLATGIKLPGMQIGTVQDGSDCEILGLTQTPQGFTHFL
ncbi:unannotated protein [freshwater metagenome]|jgi:thiamine-monophosphate kinase|uniref:Unannotated protein n=1 Tax=freshwater metagenome TaxID=449393 RepID=A0A6J6LQG5_9ZZZZ|nr:thiamine-phosphate kinase [Actinomycetota bacterium]